MAKCALCENQALADLLCTSCDWQRLSAASYDRIWRGEGLNWKNAEAFSQEAWIRYKTNKPSTKES